jgi:hypothetical protein
LASTNDESATKRTVPRAASFVELSPCARQKFLAANGIEFLEQVLTPVPELRA